MLRIGSDLWALPAREGARQSFHCLLPSLRDFVPDCAPNDRAQLLLNLLPLRRGKIQRVKQAVCSLPEIKPTRGAVAVLLLDVAEIEYDFLPRLSVYPLAPYKYGRVTRAGISMGEICVPRPPRGACFPADEHL